MGNLAVVGICSVYIIARSAGKYLGARWGSMISKESKNVKNYLGLMLLPQAGVAIGMARSSSSTFRSIADAAYALDNAFDKTYLYSIASTITAVVLCATLIYELVGPVLTKIALTKAGEIESETKRKVNTITNGN